MICLKRLLYPIVALTLSWQLGGCVSHNSASCVTNADCVTGTTCAQNQCLPVLGGADLSQPQNGGDMGTGNVQTMLAHALSKRIGEPGDDRGTSVAVDSQGNIVLAARFNGALDLEGTVYNSMNSILLAKFSKAGKVVWAKTVGNLLGAAAVNYTYPAVVALGPNDDIILTGGYYRDGNYGGAVDCGDGIMHIPQNGADIFVCKYNTGGACLWSSSIGGMGNEQATSAAVDQNGNIVLTGFFMSKVDFGNGMPLMPTGAEDIFVARLKPDGSLDWANRYGSAMSDIGRSVAVTAGGEILVTGTFYQGVDFGGGLLRNDGNGDIFLLRLSQQGAHIWSKSFGGTGQDEGTAVAVAQDETIALTGMFGATADMNRSMPGTVVFASKGRQDAFVASYGPNGQYRWARALGGIMDDAGRQVAFDGSGNILVLGAFAGSVDFGTGSTSGAGQDCFLSRYATIDGTLPWAKVLGGAGTEDCLGMFVGRGGDVLITGFTSSDQINLGGSDLFTAGTGKEDILLLKLTPTPIG